MLAWPRGGSTTSQPWDITHVLLRTTATASPGMPEGASPPPSCHCPGLCLLQPMAPRAPTIPAQQRGHPGAGTRDTGSVTLLYSTGVTGQTKFPEVVWVQPLDPFNTVEKTNAEPLRPRTGTEHPPTRPPRSSSGASLPSWRLPLQELGASGKSKERPRVQSVPVLEQQGLPPCPAPGAAGGGEQYEPPSNLHAG